MIRLCLAVLSAAIIPRWESDRVQERDAATRLLVRLGPAALASIREALRHPDPEVAGRARDACRVICRVQIPDLHAFALLVQHETGKRFLWTTESGLDRQPLRVISDFPLEGHPELLFKAFRMCLCESSLALVPVGRDGQEVYKIRPAISGKRGPVVPMVLWVQRGPTIRVESEE